MLIATVVLIQVAQSPGAQLEIVRGVQADGRATLQWNEMISKRLSPADFRAMELLEKPYTPAELAWARRIESRQKQWQDEIPSLASPFRPIAAPDGRVVLGNRGGEDAFTHDPHTIGFDLERLHSLYGDVSSEKNELIDRLFRHEYTHLLQKAWLREHPQPLDTGLQLALFEMWTEGMGNYYSLSANWRSGKGKVADKAVETLRVLEPKLVARLTALACASPEQAQKLMSGLSSGPFERKWGALPVALWLESESHNPEFMREFIVGGTNGVWALASRHLSPGLKPQLEEIQRLQTLCK